MLFGLSFFCVIVGFAWFGFDFGETCGFALNLMTFYLGYGALRVQTKSAKFSFTIFISAQSTIFLSLTHTGELS